MNKLEIGLPLTFTSSYIDEYQLAKESLLSLTIIPKTQTFISPGREGAFRIFELKPAINEEGAPPPITIYFEPTQIQETFTNELTEHFLAQILKTSERLNQVFQSLGVTAGKEFNEAVNKLGESAKKFLGGILPNSVGTISSNITSALSAVLTGERFDFPKMWLDSKADLNYEVTTKLQCNNPDSDNEFKKYIIEPLTQLLKYVLPRSASKDHYTWPFFCGVKAPGLFDLPEAIVSSISINKGAGVNFGTNNRPNYVEVTLTFTNIRNVMVNDFADPSTVLPYTLTGYTKTLKDKKQNYNISTLKVSNVSATRGTRGLSRNISDDQRSTFNGLADVYPNTQGTY